MRLEYVGEKFLQAVLTLASEGTIKFRLACAAEYLIRLNAEDFPDDELRPRFLELERKLTKVEPRGEEPKGEEEFREIRPDEGSIQASVYAMSEEEAEKLAQEIVEMFTDIAYRDPSNLYHPFPK